MKHGNDRRFNLSRKKNRRSKDPFFQAFLSIILLLVLGFVSYGVFHKTTLSPYVAKRVNQRVCKKYYQEDFSGVIADIGIINGSKVKSILFTDNTIKVPRGLYSQLPRIDIGDSIHKRANSFSYVVFPLENRDSSFVLHPYKGYKCSNF
jgi:hypothetical protein